MQKMGKSVSVGIFSIKREAFYSHPKSITAFSHKKKKHIKSHE